MTNNSNNITTQKEGYIKHLIDIECLPSFMNEEHCITDYTQLSLSKLPSMGIIIDPLTKIFNQLTNDGQAKSGIYKVTIPSNAHLATFKNESNYLGTFLSTNNRIAGQARLNPVMCDPSSIFMAAAFASIDNKLDNIQEMQKEILDFLTQKERSELKGDLNFLTDILHNFKFNWKNETYKNNNHIKVLDIRHDAQRKIDFYREQIASKMQKKSFLHNDQEIKKRFKKLQSEFNDYQLALYLYSFSSFVEILLLENFDDIYLKGITYKIEEYSLKYRELYTTCYEQIDNHTNSSAQSHLLEGLAAVNRFTGKAASKVPVVSKSKIDEKLIETGHKIGKFNRRRREKVMHPFIEKRHAYIRPFIENIHILSELYNQPIELLFDEKHMYIKD